MNWNPLHRPAWPLLAAAVLLGSACAGGGMNQTRDEEGLKWVPGSYVLEGFYTVRTDTEFEVSSERRRYRAEVVVSENEQRVVYNSEGVCLPIEKRGRYLGGPYRSTAFECGESVLTISPDRHLIRGSAQIVVTEMVQERAGCQIYSADGVCLRPEVTLKLQKVNRSPRLNVRPGGG